MRINLYWRGSQMSFRGLYCTGSGQYNKDDNASLDNFTVFVKFVARLYKFL